MNQGYKVPVAVVVFNRPVLTEKMLMRLAEIRPQKLFVISDAARTDRPGEKEKVEKVRALFEHISWPCEVVKDYAETNLGCDKRIPSGLDKVFDQVDRAIILEDDCIPDLQFFRYAEEMLERYQNDSNVMMVSGSNQMPGYEIRSCCCFTARVYTWGWATWRRAWRRYCGDDSEWLRIQKEGILRKTYGFRARYYVKKELNHYFQKGQCPWDYLWWVSCIGAGGLCAVPKVNLISNEGFGEDATHTQEKGTYSGETYHMDFPLHFPEDVLRDRRIDQYDRGLNPPWKIVRAWRRLRRR